VAKPRVHELAKELDPTGKKVTSKVILAWLKDQGEFVKAASSAVEPPVARRVREHFAAQVQEAPADTRTDKPTKTASEAAPEAPSQVSEEPVITLAQAERALHHLAARLLHQPTVMARRAGQDGHEDAYRQALELVLGLDSVGGTHD